MKDLLVVGVHPDDETLGCGGVLLRNIAKRNPVHWLLITSVSQEGGFSEEDVHRQQEIVETVNNAYPFSSFTWLKFPTTKVDTIPQRELVNAIATVFEKVRPYTVILPFYNDPHSDHQYVFSAGYSCTKSFRYPSIHRILMMETPSETDFASPFPAGGFIPNFFVDITEFMGKKKEILSLYSSELGKHPFPRSSLGIEALATLRGASTGSLYAEAFMLLKERV